MKNYINYIEKYKHFQSGEYFFEEGEYTEACKEYQLTTELDPDFIDAYHSWGHALLELEDYDIAIDKFKKCTELDNKVKAYFFDWGITLLEIKHYEESIKKFEKCIKLEINDLDYYNSIDYDLYAYNNIAEILDLQGRYNEAKEKWNELLCIYRRREDISKSCRDTEFFLNYGKVFCCVFHKLEEAECVFLKGLEIKSDDTDILENLIHVYIQMYERDKPDTKYYWEAMEQYKKAKKILEENLSEVNDDIEYKIEILYQLGRISSDIDNYLESEKFLLEANTLGDYKSIEIYADLGILYLYTEEFKKSIQYLENALQKDLDNLNTKSFLAEAYLKNELIDSAEAEYNEIEHIAPYNVDAIIGLGEVYSEMADESEDEDMYDEAMRYIDKALNMNSKEKKKISKRLNKKEIANLYYSKCYVNVKLSNISNSVIKLYMAFMNISRCLANDPYNHDAKRLKEKILKELIYSRSLTEKIGTIIVFIISLILLIIDLLRNDFTITIFTFVFLIFLLVSIYMPQIIKLKMHVIEIEKTPYQITSKKIIEIKRLH